MRYQDVVCLANLTIGLKRVDSTSRPIVKIDKSSESSGCKDLIAFQTVPLTTFSILLSFQTAIGGGGEVELTLPRRVRA